MQPRNLTEQRFCLYDSAELDPVMAIMAQQILALMPLESLIMVGVLRRGEPLAKMLQQRLLRLTGCEPPVYPLKVKRYADDLSLQYEETLLSGNPQLAKLNFSDASLLVVDDVLYQGHSLLRTCCYLANLGARRAHCAVLVDRCVCQQPIQADVVGLRLQVAASDVIECHVPPYEDRFRIEVWRRPAASS